MAKFFFQRTLTGMKAYDTDAEKLLAKIKINEVFEADVVRSRNAKLSSKYWVLVNLILPHQTRYKTREALSNAIKQQLGYCDVYPARNANEAPVIEYHSIAFAKMNNDDFTVFYQAVIDFVITVIVPGLDEGDLRRELEAFNT